MKDDLDIRRRTNQVNGAFATIKRVLCNKDIPAKLREQLYDATVINTLLWGCKSWALTEELQRKLEVYHHRFQWKMVGITIYNVKDNYISNKQVRVEQIVIVIVILCIIVRFVDAVLQYNIMI